MNARASSNCTWPTRGQKHGLIDAEILIYSLSIDYAKNSFLEKIAKDVQYTAFWRIALSKKRMHNNIEAKHVHICDTVQGGINNSLLTFV